MNEGRKEGRKEKENEKKRKKEKKRRKKPKKRKIYSLNCYIKCFDMVTAAIFNQSW